MSKTPRRSPNDLIVDGFHFIQAKRHQRQPKPPRQVLSANWERSETNPEMVTIIRKLADGSQERDTATIDDAWTSGWNFMTFMNGLMKEGEDYLKTLVIAVLLLGVGLFCWHIGCCHDLAHDVAHYMAHHAAVM